MRAKLPTKLICTLSRTRPSYPSSRISPRQHHLSDPPSIQPPPQARTLSTTSPLSKKGSAKQASKRATVLPASSKAHTQAAVDAFDFSDYAATITRVHEHLKADLAKIKVGGSNVEDIEGLRVVLRKGDGDARGDKKVKGKEKGDRGESVKLGDVASVVARGRNVGVLVGEKDHLAPVLSALAPLPHTTSPTDPLTLTIATPPVTAESRQAAKKRADKRGEEALFALREARGAQRKRYRGLELGKAVVPDELRRAWGEVERMSERAAADAKGMVEGCRRGLEGG